MAARASGFSLHCSSRQKVGVAGWRDSRLAGPDPARPVNYASGTFDIPRLAPVTFVPLQVANVVREYGLAPGPAAVVTIPGASASVKYSQRTATAPAGRCW